MADEIAFEPNPLNAGQTTWYAVLSGGTNIVKASDGSLVADSTANYSLGKIPVSDSVRTNRYVANAPNGTPNGTYSFYIRSTAGTNSVSVSTDAYQSGAGLAIVGPGVTVVNLTATASTS